MFMTANETAYLTVTREDDDTMVLSRYGAQAGMDVKDLTNDFSYLMEWVAVVFCFRHARSDLISVHLERIVTISGLSVSVEGGVISAHCLDENISTDGKPSYYSLFTEALLNVKIFGHKWQPDSDGGHVITIQNRRDLYLYDPDEADGENKDDREQTNLGNRFLKDRSSKHSHQSQ